MEGMQIKNSLLLFVIMMVNEEKNSSFIDLQIQQLQFNQDQLALLAQQEQKFSISFFKLII